VAAFQSSREIGGFWQIVATAAPGRTLEELQRAIRAEIDRLLDRGPDDEEVERGRTIAEAQFVYRLQTLGGFGGKSDQLNAYAVFLGDPGYFERDLERYRDVRGHHLHDAARRYLSRSRVALSVVPLGRSADALRGSVPVALT
jgi:zinc protease